MKKNLTKIVLIIIAMLTAFSFSACYLFEGEVNPPTPEVVYEADLPDSKELADSVDFGTSESTVSDRLKAIEKVSRSVVAIKIETENSTSYGSGVIVDIDAKDQNNATIESENEFYILTCHHVVSGMGNITVYVPDKNSRNFGDENYDENFAFTGVIGNKIYTDKAITLVGGDKDTDVAVLKLDLSKSTAVSKSDMVECQVPIYNSSEYSVKLGEDVFAIGNPSGILPMTVSNGIVSYLDRIVAVGSIGDMKLLQIDVQINHGNSGGGLFNYRGELVGITNAGSDDYDGLNYAIPYKNAYGEDSGFITVAKQLIATKTDKNYGYISGRWILGVTVREETVENVGARLIVEKVEVGSNAEKAGIKVGDIITKVEYKDADGVTRPVEITTSASLSMALAEIKKVYKMGESFSITVGRKVGEEIGHVPLTLELTKQYIFCDTGIYPPKA